MAAAKIPEPTIDLTGPNGMQFEIKEGKCSQCKGQWPLLTNIGLCQACIIIHLPKDLIGEKVAKVPDSFMKKDGNNNDCIVCYEDTTKMNIYHCSGCREIICIDCVKQLPKDGHGFNQCPYCRVDFRIEGI